MAFDSERDRDGLDSRQSTDGSTDGSADNPFASVDPEFWAPRVRTRWWLVILAYLAGVATIPVFWLGTELFDDWNSTARLAAAHQELTAIHKEIADQVRAAPADEVWSTFVAKIKVKTTKVAASIAGSKHRAKPSLSSAISALRSAVGKKTPQEAEEKLEMAAKKLDDAKKKLKI